MVLKRFFAEETQAQKEFRRLIAREKSMIPENKVVLIHQLLKVMEETTPAHSVFGKFLRDHIHNVHDQLQNLLRLELIPEFKIKQSELSEDLQRHILGIPDYRTSLDDAYEVVAQFMAYKATVDNTGPAFDPANTLPPEDVLKMQPYNGFYMVHVAHFLSRTSFFTGDNLEWHENESIRLEEGRFVLDFWKGVNEATDYFPDAEPPRGNKPDDSGGRAKVTEWIEGIGGQPRPSEA